MLCEPLGGGQNCGQDSLGRGRRNTMVEEPTDRVVKIGARLPRKVPESTHTDALVFRAIVALTRSATSSPVR